MIFGLPTPHKLCAIQSVHPFSTWAIRHLQYNPTLVPRGAFSPIFVGYRTTVVGIIYDYIIRRWGEPVKLLSKRNWGFTNQIIVVDIPWLPWLHFAADYASSRILDDYSWIEDCKKWSIEFFMNQTCYFFGMCTRPNGQTKGIVVHQTAQRGVH